MKAKELPDTHYHVGQEVREAIKRLGGTMPEDLPTPEKSIQQLQSEEQKRLQERSQPSLFDEPESDQEKTQVGGDNTSSTR
jgi:hypothetical protein